MPKDYIIPRLPLPYDFESKEILKQLIRSHRRLAELVGAARLIPNENILISTLTLQEAKESSSIENIITTQDELYRADLGIKSMITNASAKEVFYYREAIQHGFQCVKERGVLTLNIIKEIQSAIEKNRAGFRAVPGTVLKRDDGMSVYTPPQDGGQISELMGNLETFINDPSISACDPLVKMAVIHHQFESIHPFYDGNGRTGRIVNVLYLVISGLLDLPVLYLSRYITRTKSEYYRLLQAVRDSSPHNAAEWEAWVLYILRGIEETAAQTTVLVRNIASLMTVYKGVLRPVFGKNYRHELLNNLFFHPYTKIEFLQRDMQIERRTAAKYLDRIVSLGLLEKVKHGNANYYINNALMRLFIDLPTSGHFGVDELETLAEEGGNVHERGKTCT